MKEKIMVSACLMGENCKYSGGNNYQQSIVDYVQDKEVLQVCPEMLAGLSTPRYPCEIVGGKVYNSIGEDQTEAFEDGAKKTLQLAEEQDIKIAILQTRSPSCGCGIIYSGKFDGTKTKGNGKTTQLLLDNGIKVYSSDDKRFEM